MAQGAYMPEKIRIFKRCKSSLPIDVKIGDLAVHEKDYLIDISLGGLSFKSRSKVDIGTVIEITIPLTYPVYQTLGKVLWCKKEKNFYNVGIKYILPNNKPTVEAVEQVCDISAYRSEIYKKEGKVVSSEDAALRWLNEYIKQFESNK
jgi:hypothetical protein